VAEADGAVATGVDDGAVATGVDDGAVATGVDDGAVATGVDDTAVHTVAPAKDVVPAAQGTAAGKILVASTKPPVQKEPAGHSTQKRKEPE